MYSLNIETLIMFVNEFWILIAGIIFIIFILSYNLYRACKIKFLKFVNIYVKINGAFITYELAMTAKDYNNLLKYYKTCNLPKLLKLIKHYYTGESQLPPNDVSISDMYISLASYE